jgi:hypothetical protein
MVINNIIKSKREKNEKFFHYNLFIKNRRGWIKLVEVFVAVLILTAIFFIIANRSSSSYNDKKSLEISQKEIGILRDIELNYTLRTEILSAAPLPVEWESFDSGLPKVRERIISLIPPNLECQAKICLMNDFCKIDELSGKDVYAKSVIISANLNTYSPRQLKLFCMLK